MAANSFLRAAFAASFPLCAFSILSVSLAHVCSCEVTVQMYDALGTRWASLLCAGLIGLLVSSLLASFSSSDQFLGSFAFSSVLQGRSIQRLRVSICAKKRLAIVKIDVCIPIYKHCLSFASLSTDASTKLARSTRLPLLISSARLSLSLLTHR